MNEGVVVEEKDMIKVNVANDQQVSFPLMKFTGGRVDAEVIAKTSTEGKFVVG